ncbi:MAG: hypothetical protein JW765_03100 [Deltaproteobacteria bacterium]|nr:hypothetical protein [Candidatus Zymogenaceae bacterium]
MKKWIPMRVVTFALFVIFLLGGAGIEGWAQTVLLVTPEEAAGPDARAVIVEKNDGPIIVIKSPENGSTQTGPFRLYVEIMKREGGGDIDMDSLAVKYLKLVPIDITGRVRDYITGSKMDVPDAEFPEGSHRAEILVRDTAGNESSKLFSVTVAK